MKGAPCSGPSLCQEPRAGAEVRERSPMWLEARGQDGSRWGGEGGRGHTGRGLKVKVKGLDFILIVNLLE